jgi:hypothetical protein
VRLLKGCTCFSRLCYTDKGGSQLEGLGYRFRLSSRESKRPRKFSNYVALMRKIIDSEPSTFEEAAKQQVWKDAMMEEYQSIMKNDVWEVVRDQRGSQ